MSMRSKIETIPKILLTVLSEDRVSHYEALRQNDYYAVWAEDSEGDSVAGDNRKIAQAIQGTIDYYTKNDMDERVDKIQGALKNACISFYLNSVQYEDETGYIHYEWVWEVS